MKRAPLVVFIVVVFQQYSESIDLFGSLEDTRDALLGFYDPSPGPQIAKPTTKSTVAIPFVSKGLKSTGSVTKVIRKSGWSGSRKRLGGGKTKFPYKKTSKMISAGITVAKLAIVKQVTPRRKQTAKLYQRPSKNKFSEALEDIEKALADAQETSSKLVHNLQRLRRLKKLIETAVSKRSYRFARKIMGEAMYTIAKIKEGYKGKGRQKRQTVISPQNFLGSVRQSIGKKAFSDLLAMQGQVTLMFAIDTTGSMASEIKQAKFIAETIANQTRTEPVDYILSPFTDPVKDFKGVKYFDETQHKSFITSLNKINVNGGGDCPEFAFKGMIDAIELGQPLDDSPMYVFTDAGAKDGDEDNIKHLLEIAEEYGIIINFFVVDTYCTRKTKQELDAFDKIAKSTTGQLFRLKNSTELGQLAGITANSLGGTTVISTATNTVAFRKKRSSAKQSKTYTIPVDDSIDTLVISVTADHPHGSVWSVTLTTPSGSNVSPQIMNKVIIYQISNPSVGNWKLKVDSASYVKYDYYAKGSSRDNIDFEFYFVKKSRKGSLVPISNPIKGQKAQAVLTLGGINNIDKNSLQAELVTVGGVTFTSSSFGNILKSEDKGGTRHSFTFTPPGNLFKIKLKGKTKKGNSFERISHYPIKLGSLLIKVLYVRNDYTVSPNQKTHMSFMIENKGNQESVDIKVFGSMGKVEKVSRNYLILRRNRRTSFRVYFKADATVSKGHTITIVVFVKGRKSGTKSTISVPILVV